MHGRGNPPLSAALGHTVDQPTQSKVVHRIIMSLAKTKSSKEKGNKKDTIHTYVYRETQSVSL